MSSPLARSSSARAARCCSCTGRSTTTGRSPRASSTRASTSTAAAVREVAEETGLDVRLGPPLPLAALRRNAAAGTKHVHYWVGRVVGDDDVSTYRPTPRSTSVAWVPLDEGRRTADLPPRPRHARRGDRAARKSTTPLVVLRHGKAAPRKQLGRRRPPSGRCTDEGEAAGRAAGPGARGVRRRPGASAPRSTRCVQTVAARTPTCTCCDLEPRSASCPRRTPTPDAVSALVRRAARPTREPTRAVHATGRCCRRLRRPRRRRPGSSTRARCWSCHHRKGEVVAVERHLTPDGTAPAAVHVTAVSRPPGVAKPGVRVHLSFTGADGSRHLRSLASVMSSHCPNNQEHEVNSSLPSAGSLAPGVAVLALGLTLSACGAGNESRQQPAAAALSGTLNGAGSSAQEAAQAPGAPASRSQHRRHRQLRPGRLRRRRREVHRRRRATSPAPTPTSTPTRASSTRPRSAAAATRSRCPRTSARSRSSSTSRA